jgi:hypothetical protein
MSEMDDRQGEGCAALFLAAFEAARGKTAEYYPQVKAAIAARIKEIFGGDQAALERMAAIVARVALGMPELH